jgi:hypothetical protein
VELPNGHDEEIPNHFHFPGLDAQSCQTFVLKCHQGKHIDVQMLQGDDAIVMKLQNLLHQFCGTPFCFDCPQSAHLCWNISNLRLVRRLLEGQWKFQVIES